MNQCIRDGITRTVLTAFIFLALMSSGWSQSTYTGLPFIRLHNANNTPLHKGPEKEKAAERRAFLEKNDMAFQVPAEVASTPPTCSNAPTAAQLRSFGNFQAMSVKDAASLSLAFFGASGSAQFSDNSEVVVYRAGSQFVCPSTDGNYLVTYGTEVDGGIAISQQSLSGNASFATIAANAQISGASTSYDYAATGFTDSTTWDTANGRVLSDVASTLTVQNYAAFNTDWSAVLATVPNLQKPTTPVVIGYAPIGITGLAEDLAAGYALMYIAQGRGCEDAVKAFPTQAAWVDPAIRKVYSQLSKGKSDCDGAADPTEAALAHQLLSGIEIKTP
jgi:hypothetical protein